MTVQQITDLMMDKIAALEVIASETLTKNGDEAHAIAVSTYALFNDVEKIIEENEGLSVEQCIKSFVENGSFTEMDDDVVILRHGDNLYLKKTQECAEKSKTLYGILISIANVTKCKQQLSEKDLRERLLYNKALNILTQRLMKEMHELGLKYMSDSMIKATLSSKSDR